MTPQDPAALFLHHLDLSLQNDTFQKLTLGKYRGDEPSLEKVKINRVVIKGTPHLSFTYRFTTKDIVKNLPLDDGREKVASLVGSSFLTAHLFSNGKEYALEYSKKRVPLLRVHEASVKVTSSTHNREKNHLIPSSAPFFRSLGIANDRGEVRGERYDKFRQINKFIEIIDSLLTEGKVYDQKVVRVVDFGSGKNYLTFALYYYLTAVRGKEAHVIGVEVRRDLVEYGRKLAEEGGFSGLTFAEGRIGEFYLSDADLVVALHACDTATDDAIAQAIKAKAKVIAVAPCCQRYLRPRMTIPSTLRPVLKHGILEERHAESLTDGLRSLVLESQGYQSKVFEFISGGHTPKNVMITGVLGSRVYDRRLEEIEELKREYQLSDFYLDKLLAL